MTLKKDLAAAKKAQEKLATFASGLPTGADNPKFDELNAKANEAVEKLPKSLRSRMALDFLA